MTVALGVYTVALAAAAVWSLSMVIAKRGLSAEGTTLQLTVIVAGVDAVVYWALLAAREGSDLLTVLSPVAVGIFVLAGVVGTALARLASFGGIDRVGASVNSAGISTRPLFATALALVFLGERISLGVGAGIGVLVCGVVLLSLSRGGDIGGWKTTDLLFPLGAAAGFATADVIRRYGLTTTGTTALHGVTLNETAGVLALAAYVLVRRPETFRSVSARTYAVFGLSGAANALSFLLFFVALDIGPVAIASSLIGTTPLFTLVFTYLFLGDVERVTGGVIAGAGLVVLGTVVVAVG